MIGLLLTNPIARGLIGGLAVAGLLFAYVEVREKRAAKVALTEERAAIERINNELSRSAISAREGQRRCVALGHDWMFATSTCSEAGPDDDG